MRELHVNSIIEAVSEMCIEANYYLSDDIKDAFLSAKDKEESPIGKDIIDQLIENAGIAKNEKMPICQDTGMAVVFCEIGQDLHIVGGNLEEAIHEGVRQGYEKGFLRKSVVKDPLIRENTGDNTPAVVYYELVSGSGFKVTVAPKGFGSENMSKIFMLKPADGIEGVKKAILDTVEQAGPNACPPIIVGVGLGGTFDKAAYLAKKALLRPVGQHSPLSHIKELEDDLLKSINELGIGPQGLGGRTTALDIHIETYPTHIAGLPVAINISCHVTRHVSREL